MTQTETGIPFMITAAMKERLRGQGYSDEQIAHMSPQEAHEILGPDDEDKGVVIALARIKARHSPPEKDPNKQYPYRLIPFEELRPGTKSGFIVEGVIPETGIVAVWGPPKCGKSFWTFDLTMHIALGWKYRDRDVDQGPVVYLAFEGAEGFNNRAEAFRHTHAEALERRTAFYREHGIPDEIWFHLLPSNAKLVRDHKALIESIDGQVDRPPAVVVLDTLNRSIDGSESKDVDMGAYLAAAEVICDEFGCVVIIVHHCGVDGTRPRGHTSLPGAVASQIAIKRNDAGHILAEVEAMKDGAEGASFTSALQLVEVGTTTAGKPITSCAIIPVEGAPQSAGKSAGTRLTGNQNRFLDILRDAILDVPPEHKTTVDIPGGRVAVSREWLKMCCISKGWLEDDGSNKSRAKLSEMINTLAGKRIIGTSKLFVWDVR
jgi:hypothetical protein